jgi:glutamate-1-semialdehyde 2,1-aminomutase
MKKNAATRAWNEARENLASGVNSPVRAFNAVGGKPVFMRRGRGPFLYDNQGLRYLDYCLSWGAMLLGHAFPATVKALQVQSACGTSFGTATEMETALAKEIKKAFPGIERIRFTSSGTEAVMSALRLARGITGHDRVLKFEGCYHGHADSLLVKAGSGLATFGTASSAGIPAQLARLTSVLPYNNVTAARKFFRRTKNLACVIVEPIAANMGLVPASSEFLQILKKGSAQAGALLIFDEVISGFRVGYGGAQHLYGISPDLTILGKIIGGGLPVGAFGGKKNWMDYLSPSGPVYQAGTLSGNPLSMAAGLSVLSRLSQAFYKELQNRADCFFKELRMALKKRNGQSTVQNAGSAFTIFFGIKKAQNFEEAKRCDQPAFRRFFHHMLTHGVYVPPSAFETSFLSSAHSSSDLKKTLEALGRF